MKRDGLTCTTRLVPMPIPVSESASDITENAGIGISEYASLCTNPIPCDLLAAKWYPATSQLIWLAPTDVHA